MNLVGDCSQSLYFGGMQSSHAITVIANPAARSGRLLRRIPRIVTALKRQGFVVALKSTEYPGHARKLARAHARDHEILVAVGGDGTVNEIASGILDAGAEATLAVIPEGTGNDFARMIGMSTRLFAAVRQIQSGSVRRVDVGCVDWTEHGEDRSGYFVNALGVGFDGYAASLAGRYKQAPLGAGYLLTILAALRTWVPAGVTIWDQTHAPLPKYSGPLFFVTVGNARDSAGGYRINPKASITDGFLDVCLVQAVGLKKALFMLPLARFGRHLCLREVTYWHTTDLRVESDRSVPFHADGEVLATEARRIRIRIIPERLNVLVAGRAISSE